ncbi:ribosome maturation protein [Dipodascopsis tothii]|uniref:ribosome maturation protein n=1 Tax=Dipodascopsis tothii TaxID=44089 RepID=UPI0034CF8183
MAMLNTRVSYKGGSRVIYKGEADDFIVIISSPEEYQKFKKDSSVPLVDVVDSFKVFTTDRHGSQGLLNEASNLSLENEFGSSKDVDVVSKILRSGNFLSPNPKDKSYNSRNDSMGFRVGY